MITVDGNDGTGKSTLVRDLKGLGYLVQDRGIPTKMTDDPNLRPGPGDGPFLILDAPVEISQERLKNAGKDLTEQYHTLADLTHYRQRFQEVAATLGVDLIDTSEGWGAIGSALGALGTTNMSPMVGLPTGRLEEPVMATLRDLHYDVYRYRESRIYHIGEVRNVEMWRMKARAIPEAVALGILDFGITGSDILRESLYEDQLQVLGTVLPGKQTLSVLQRDRGDDMREIVKTRPLRIATEYPRIASRWAYEQGLAHVCIQTWGTTEAWVPYLADIAIDTVSSGETARVNGLKVVDTILTVETVLVARKSFVGAPFHEFARAFAPEKTQ